MAGTGQQIRHQAMQQEQTAGVTRTVSTKWLIVFSSTLNLWSWPLVFVGRVQTRVTEVVVLDTLVKLPGFSGSATCLQCNC